jgi:hypothetical protein
MMASKKTRQWTSDAQDGQVLHGLFFSNVLFGQEDAFELGHVGGKGPWTSNQGLIRGPF